MKRDFSRTIAFGLLISVVVSWFAILWLRSLSVFGVWPVISPDVWWYLVYFMAVLLLGAGFFLSEILQTRKSRLFKLGVCNRHQFWVLVMSGLAIFGVAIMFYEFMVVRGYPLFGEVRELRIIEVNRSLDGHVGSWVGAVGRLLMTALVVALMISAYCWRKVSRWALVVTFAALVIVSLYQARFEGGRTPMFALLVATAVSYLLGLTYRWKNDKNLSFGIAIRECAIFSVGLSAYMVILLLYSGAVFTDRAKGNSKSAGEIYREYSQTLGVNAAETWAFATRTEVGNSGIAGEVYRESGNSSIQESVQLKEELTGVQFQLAMVWVYITQGPNEFDRVISHEKLNHASGRYQFPQLGQLASKLSGQDLRFNPWTELPSVGTYPTLAGGAYIDFGWWGGLLYGLIVGAVLGVGLIVLLRLGYHPLAFVGPPLFVVALASPIVSLITNIWPAFLWLGLIWVIDALRQRHHSMVVAS